MKQLDLEMIQMLNGLKIGNKFCLISVILFMTLFSSCNKADPYKYKYTTGDVFQVSLNDSMYVDIKCYESGVIETITTKDRFGMKNGLSLEYHPNGMLRNKYFWENDTVAGGYWIYNDIGELQVYYTYVGGEKNGDMYEYDNNTNIKSHFLFENGKAVFVAYYEKGQKNISSAIPIFKNEMINNDSIYNVRITFPFPFKGDLEIFLKDTLDFNLEQIDKYNIDLTITNFDERWTAYEFLLEYEPVEGDSLSRTEQVYKRVLELDR
ncbi:toxin-antitoxin system YwqK family antitoxin [Lunatibacter salilacus]|uniref:toxin-antitoxin system YwqK family antitoxin n=1 Tax=Lunatibacter salilacus TaxID=2483804 RepID=UPI00131AEA05|nr:hypothetical protein [Lunatibacter salilacus]